MSDDRVQPDKGDDPQRPPPLPRTEDDRLQQEPSAEPERPRRRPRYEEDDHEDRPRRNIRREPDMEATDLIVPTNVSVWSLLSCYLGLIGFCLPLVGLLFSIPAVIFGVIALRRKKQEGSQYGKVTSDIRAWIGVVLGTLGTIVGLALGVILLIAAAKG